MTGGLRAFLGVTDAAMLAYWALAGLAAAGAIALPAAVMYGGYGTPVIDAWNWSFAPLDLAFALIGLASVRAAAQGRAWRGLATVSLTLTMCAGGMAIAFWALRREFDPAWWGPNLVLLLAPLVWLPGLVKR